MFSKVKDVRAQTNTHMHLLLDVTIALCAGTSLLIRQSGLLLATLQVCSLFGSLQSGLLLAMLPVCSLFGSLGRIVEESSVGLISQVVPNLYIAAPLACACRHSVLCAHDVSSGAEQRPEPLTIQSCT